MGAQLWRASDILDMAVQVELTGLSFYRAFEQTRDEAEIKDILNFLISQEQRHMQLFRKMKEDAGSYSFPESYAGEISGYSESFVKDRVFQGPDEAREQAQHISDPAEAFDLAERFEHRSIALYERLKQFVRSEDRQTVDEVIAEERKHIERIESFRKSLNKRGWAGASK